MAHGSCYGSLSRAQLSFDYLHTNSTTHEFLFGALAELVDNARDASATKINIFTEPDESLRGGYRFCFLDDGEGMDPNESADIVTFGRSAKKDLEGHQIGMYGNGLKSGSMRIGNDLMVFSKKGVTMSCMFLSRTFHEEEAIEEVIVPIPSFETSTRRPLSAKGAKAQEKHAVEMSLILKYSPFHTEDDFFAQFDKIDGNSGTLVIVYNMKLLDSGEPELDIYSDPMDIMLANPSSDFDSDDGLAPERKSFRAYTAILYMDPRMKVYIQGKKVRTKRLACCLYKPRLYKYSSNRFKARSESEIKKAQEEAKSAEYKAREAESKSKNLEKKYGSSLSKDQRAELRKAQQFAAECKREAQLKKEHADRKAKASKDPKTLNLIFGVNIENRSHDGVFVYNCSRMIKMYEKVGPQADGGVFCSGVVGIVDVPYLVLEPTHNKQDFADAKEYRHLMKAMGEHMVQYWKDVGIAQQGVTKFWESFGYISQRWKDMPSEDNKYVRKRAMQVNITLQCDQCLKWRTLPFSSNNIGKEFDNEWICMMNPDSQHNKCSAAEQKMNITEGVLKKESKDKEVKEKKLEEQIKKNQEKLDQMKKTKVVTSTRHVQELEKEKKREEEEKEKKEAANKNKTIYKAPPVRQASLAVSRQNSTPVVTNSRPKSTPPPTRQMSSPVVVNSSKSKTVNSANDSKSRTVAVKSPSVTITPRSTSTPKSKPEPRSKAEIVVKQSTRATPAKTTTRGGQTAESKTAVNSKSEATKRRVASSASSVLDSDSDTPVKRSRTVSSAESDSDSAQTKKGKSNSIDVDSDSENVETKKEPQALTPKAESSIDEEDSELVRVSVETSMETDEDINHVSFDDVDSNDIVGTRVEALLNKKWYAGKVVKVNSLDGKWKVKFDTNPRDKYDKWFDKNGPDIKCSKVKKSVNESPIQGPPSPESISSHDTAAEAPTSSTATTSVPTPSTQITEEIANGYRTCLRYFLPPQWIMDKDAISAMSLQELCSFPLDDFFDHYEKGLRKLVGNFQTEAAQRKQECETASSKLSSVRKLIAKLLKSINEEFDIDPEADGDQVDELLAACVRQAAQSQP